MDEFDFGDMSGLDFGDFDLSGLENMDLSGLADMDMSGIDFGDFDLSGLEGLEGLDLSGLEGMDLSSVDLGDLEGLNLDSAGGNTRSLFGGGESGYSPEDQQGLDDLMAKFSGEDVSGPLLTPDGVDESLISGGDAKVGSGGYYNEETGEFIYDENGGLRGPLDETSGTNSESMDGYTYDKKSGTWTTPRGETYTPKTPPSHQAKSGAQVMVNAGALPSGYAGLTPEKGSTAATSGSGSGSGSGSKSGTGEKKDDWMKYIMLLMALDAMRNKGGGSSGAVIPSLSASRSTTPYAEIQKAPGYRPGQGGVQYFGPTVYRAAGGGIGALDAAGGRLLRGPGDGVSDDIVAQIGDNQPARLADGEYVLDARTVSEIGNGSTDAGADKIAEMVERIHSERRNAKRGEPSNADKKLLA
jgi:hypothetical protein